jgi:hypothetical protein
LGKTERRFGMRSEYGEMLDGTIMARILTKEVEKK